MSLTALYDLADRPVGVIVITGNRGRKLITDGFAFDDIYSSMYFRVSVIERYNRYDFCCHSKVTLYKSFCCDFGFSVEPAYKGIGTSIVSREFANGIAIVYSSCFQCVSVSDEGHRVRDVRIFGGDRHVAGDNRFGNDFLSVADPTRSIPLSFSRGSGERFAGCRKGFLNGLTFFSRYCIKDGVIIVFQRDRILFICFYRHGISRIFHRLSRFDGIRLLNRFFRLGRFGRIYDRFFRFGRVFNRFRVGRIFDRLGFLLRDQSEVREAVGDEAGAVAFNGGFDLFRIDQLQLAGNGSCGSGLVLERHDHDRIRDLLQFGKIFFGQDVLISVKDTVKLIL